MPSIFVPTDLTRHIQDVDTIDIGPGMFRNLRSDFKTDSYWLAGLDTVNVQTTFEVTVPATVDASADYTISLNNSSVTVTTLAAGETTETLRDKLVAEIKANPDIYALLDPNHTIPSSTNVLSLRQRFAGEGFLVTVNTDTTNDMTVANVTATANSDAVATPGVIMFFDSADAYGNIRSYGNVGGTARFAGVVMNTGELERDDDRKGTLAYYDGKRKIPLCTGTGTTSGIAVRTVEDLNPGDESSTYVNDYGVLTTVSSGNIALPSGVEIKSPSTPWITSQVNYGTKVTVLDFFSLAG